MQCFRNQKVPQRNSDMAFPELPRSQGAHQKAPESNGLDDDRDIVNPFKSGTVSSYIRKLKKLIHNVKRQPDNIPKLMTFCLGIE